MGCCNEMLTTFNSFNILNRVHVDIETISNPFQLKMKDLFVLGARVNPKRSFLFISKLLGKHLEVHPQIPKLSGHILANLFVKTYEGNYFSDMDTLINAIKEEAVSEKVITELNKTYSLSEKVLFLGFAETATGIGHAVFSAFDNAYYVHTTREKFCDISSVFDFQEEHSHATDHLCYLLQPNVLEEVNHIVLIDDEITTGNTCLNLIRSLHQNYPNKRYTILSLLDWRTPEQEKRYQDFMEEFQVEIKNISLLRGKIHLKQNHVFEFSLTEDEKDHLYKENDYRIVWKHFKDRVYVQKRPSQYESFMKKTGRFGLTSMEHQQIEQEAKEFGEYLGSLRKGRKTLCIGSGEFIYIPSRIACYMGEEVSFKSSTRSPIFVSNEEGYPIYDRIEYQLSNGVTNYIYNLKNSGYDEIFLFFEGFESFQVLQSIYKKIRSKGIPYITFVMM